MDDSSNATTNAYWCSYFGSITFGLFSIFSLLACYLSTKGTRKYQLSPLEYAHLEYCKRVNTLFIGSILFAVISLLSLKYTNNDTFVIGVMQVIIFAIVTFYRTFKGWTAYANREMI
ncbi:hypothetical protein C9J27_05590 [Photobacterium kishitanii]|uniref:Uncharacterized protein n=1 Tax=Photobacterium kishitanii TaxID=318456 RepID=A0A2T3KLR1_9GAMM|nr:hypothetical protein C9J27_05590 [Photobacterium kishitanii]